MSLRAERVRAFFLAGWSAAALLLTACASTSPKAAQMRADSVIEGQGTDNERSAINSSNQTIFNSEHAMSTDVPAVGGNQDVP